MARISMAKRGLTGVEILVTVAVLALLAGGYWLWQSKTAVPGQLPTPTTAPSGPDSPIDTTTNWKVFTSRKGYSTRYPGNLIYEERPSGFYVFLKSADKPMGSLFYIDERGTKTLSERKQWINENFTDPVYKELSIEGIEGFTVEGELVEGYGEGLYVKNAYIDLEGKELIIGCDTDRTCRSEALDQVLSDFQFIDEAENNSIGKRVYCQDPRPRICTMECIVSPPYICGSDGKSYCTSCQACSNPDIDWYVVQDQHCGPVIL
jgi:hypothetical protein